MPRWSGLHPKRQEVEDSIDLPFCLFLILVIFLSLAPPSEANGIRPGGAMVVTVVMLNVVVSSASGMQMLSYL